MSIGGIPPAGGNNPVTRPDTGAVAPQTGLPMRIEGNPSTSQNQDISRRQGTDPGVAQPVLASRVTTGCTAEQLSKVKKGIAADTKRGVLQGFAARQANAQTITARTAEYTEHVAGATAGFDKVDESKSGYLERLAKATIPGVPTSTGDKAVERARIQVIYDQAYKAGAPSQAEKSAAEISGALQRALPPGADSLGAIGGDIPANAKASSFGAAKLQLNRFADEIFKHPHCKGLYSQDEQAAVKELVIGKALEYLKEAGVKPEDAMKLVRDNLIKVHHQQTVDHEVISGSDHGVRHVIQSNVAHTLHALDQVSDVSPKDKLMAMQIMIDHDLGYTLDAAKGSFNAAKDHPLASAAYLEMGGQNSGIFSPEEQAYMQEAVLKHSYPFGLDQPLDFSENNKGQAIANLISIVDAMGVTANTKCPALYREVLDRAALERLAQSDGPAVMQELHGIIDQAVENGKISRDVAEGYHQALNYDVSKFGAKNMILPQFGGQLLGTEMESTDNEDPPKHFALHLNFGVSEDVRILAGLLGDDSVKAFSKMVGDLPFKPTAEEEKSGKEVTDLGKRAREAEAGTPQELTTGGAVKITLTKLQA